MGRKCSFCLGGLGGLRRWLARIVNLGAERGKAKTAEDHGALAIRSASDVSPTAQARDAVDRTGADPAKAGILAHGPRCDRKMPRVRRAAPAPRSSRVRLPLALSTASSVRLTTFCAGTCEVLLFCEILDSARKQKGRLTPPFAKSAGRAMLPAAPDDANSQALCPTRLATIFLKRTRSLVETPSSSAARHTRLASNSCTTPSAIAISHSISMMRWRPS